MKKLLLSLLLTLCFMLSSKAQTEGWQKMKSLNDDIATRHRSQMVSYNGKLYFFGGYGGSGSLNDFWEYDPVTKKLTEQEQLGSNFQNPNDGSAVVIGDKMYFTFSNQLFEYNFITKKWVQKANFPGVGAVSRQNFIAVGNIIYLSSFGANTFYGYNTTDNTWLQKANYPGPATVYSFSFSADGKLYKGGGQVGSTGQYLNSFYEYNPASDTWATKASLPNVIAYATAVTYNQKGYVGSGQQIVSGATQTNGVWYEYTPATNTWVSKATGPLVHTSAGAVVDNTIFLFSGKIGNFERNFIARYNVVDNIWKTDSTYAGGNRIYANGHYFNGKIYVAGGDDSEPRIDTWEYTIASNTWARKADMPWSGFSLSGSTSIGSKLFVIGGMKRVLGSIYSNALLQYDALTNVWETKANYPGGSLIEMGTFAINGELYVGGGWSGSPFISSNGFHKFNPQTNTWTQLQSAPNNGSVIGSFAIGDIGYFIFASNGSMYAYNRLTNTWSQKQSVPLSINGGSQGGTGNVVVKNSYAYLVGMGSGLFSEVRKYDPITDKWSILFRSPFYKKGQTTITAGDDIYVGMGLDIVPSPIYYHNENDWYKLNLQEDVSSYVGDLNFNCTISENFQAGESKAFTDSEGKLFISVQAGASPAGTVCITQRSLPVNTSLRESKIVANANISYSAMFLNKNFAVINGGVSTGVRLRMYFSDAELTALVNNFNSKYGTSKNINDIQILSGSNGTGVGNLDPLDNTNAYSIYTPTISDYKTGNKYLEYTFLNGQGIIEGYAALVIPTQTLTFPTISSKVYGAIDFTTGVTSTNSNIPITYTSSNTAVATVAADGKISVKGVGSTTITASQAGNANFSAATPVTQTLTVTPAQLTVNAESKTKVYGAANPALTVTYSGFVNGDDATKLTTQPTVSTTALPASPVNTYPITVSGAVSTNYTFNYTASTLTITRAPLTLSAKNVSKTYDGVLFTGGNGVNFTGLVAGDTETSSVTGTLTYSGSSQQQRNVGKYVITPAGLFANNYTITYANGELSIDPKPITATANTVSKIYRQVDPALTYSLNGSLVTGDVISGTLSRAVGENVGTYAINRNTLTAGNNYAITFVGADFTITAKPLTITAVSRAKAYGSADPALTYTLTGTLESGDAFTGALSRNVGENVGNYSITQGTLTAGGNYAITYASANLTINKVGLIITADNKNRVQGAANPALTASFSGFVNGETSTVLTAQPLFATTANLTSAVGNYPITASGATALNYDISYVAGTLTVSPAPPIITSFSPTTSVAGATINITGNYFTGLTSVSFGGTPAASFIVNSPTSITAVVGTGASGNISIATNIGTNTLSGYTFVPRPTISASGQTTFASGGSVILTASPGTGYTYKWFKDGVEITTATSATYTATTSGAYSVSITTNGVSATSNATSVDVIFTLPANNFKITYNGETCKTSNNGKISIEAVQSRSYTAVLTGNGLNLTKPFTTTVDFADLQAGTYNVCITVAGEASYKQCFDVVVTEPKDLSVFATLDKDNKVSVALTGSDLYFIELNGLIIKTEKENLELALKLGENILKVSTAKDCQGVFEKRIMVYDKPILYPNPFLSEVNLFNLSSVSTTVEVLSLDGKVIFKKNYESETKAISVELNQLNTGAYILKATSDNSVSIFKIIKK